MSLHNASRQTSSPLKAFAFLVTFVFCCTATAKADEIGIWNFNDSDLVVDHGVGTLTTNFNLTNVVFTLGGSTLNLPPGDPAGQALGLQGGTSTANNGAYIQFSLSTVGYTGVFVSFATQGTGTGFNSNQFQYTTDGVNFVDFDSPYTPLSTYSVMVFDMGTITALNNNPNAAFRIIFNGASSASGNNRIDNLAVYGKAAEAVPEPASFVLLSIGLGGAVARRIWRVRNHSQ
jgi:hypothetical protein